MAALGSNQKLVGLDIGSSTIKCVSFSLTGSNLLLENFLYLPTPTDSFIDGVVLLPDVVAENIRRSWGTAFNSRRVVLSVPPQHSVLKQLLVDTSTGAPLEEVMKWEMEKFLPLSVEEMVFSYQILAEEEKQIEVLAAAAPKHQIESLLYTCRLAKLIPEAIEIPYLALLRLFLFTSQGPAPHQAHFIIEIGATQSMLLFVAENSLSFLRSIPIAGNSFTQAIAKGLNLRFEEAEALKITKATLNPQEAKEEPYSTIMKALEPVIKEFLNELQRSIDFYQSRSAASLELKILLSGGGALIRGMPDYLSRALNLEVMFWSPLKALAKRETPGLEEALPTLNLASGLSLRNWEKRLAPDLYENVNIALLT